jgi:hypothetical protein
LEQVFHQHRRVLQALHVPAVVSLPALEDQPAVIGGAGAFSNSPACRTPATSRRGVPAPHPPAPTLWAGLPPGATRLDVPGDCPAGRAASENRCPVCPGRQFPGPGPPAQCA